MYEYYNPYYPYTYSQQRQTQSLYKPQNMNMAMLQGKIVDSLDIVKATDIPYDGSISYFPLIDGSAIITKQLQQDGTSKMMVYKPISENEEVKPKYITEDELKEQIENIDETIKEQVKDANSKDIKDMKEEIKTLKRKLEDITDDIKYKKEK